MTSYSHPLPQPPNQSDPKRRTSSPPLEVVDVSPEEVALLEREKASGRPLGGSWRLYTTDHHAPHPLTPANLLSSAPPGWKPPPVIPHSFPSDYPPPLPVWGDSPDLTLSQFQKLTAAFAHRSVEEYLTERPSQGILELVGDRCISMALTDMLAKVPGISLQAIVIADGFLKQGITQSYLGYLYDFHDRCEFARGRNCGQVTGPQTASQPIVEDCFEAYVGFLYQELGYATIFEWLEALYEPWLAPALELGHADWKKVKRQRAVEEAARNKQMAVAAKKTLAKHRKVPGFTATKISWHVVGSKSLPGGGTAQAQDFCRRHAGVEIKAGDLKELDEDPQLYQVPWKPIFERDDEEATGE